MGAVFGVIGIIGMCVNVGMSGKDSITSTAALKGNVADMKAKIASFQAAYTALLAQESADIQADKDQIAADIESITRLAKAIQSEKTTHEKLYKSIQITGISMVTVIAFIFILKMFGFYKVLAEVLNPF